MGYSSIESGQGCRRLPAQPLLPGVTRDADAPAMPNGGDVAPSDQTGDVLTGYAQPFAHFLGCQKLFHLLVSVLPLAILGNFWYHYPVNKRSSQSVDERGV